MLPKSLYIGTTKDRDMKQYALLLLIILLSSCAPTVEVDTPKPAETPIEEQIESIEEPEIEDEEVELEEPETIEEPRVEENIIEIKPDGFYPKEKTISINTEIKWVKKDSRDYKIACYLSGNRITQSPILKEEDTFTYTFLKEGQYTCLTAPFGLRNIINVESSQQALLSPTGSAVIGDVNISRAPFAVVALLAIIVLLFFVYGRRRI